MSNLNNVTILVADDEERWRRLVCDFLRSEGYRTAEAANGVEAVSAVRNGGIDMVILDIMMPVMDGYQALMGIRNLEKDHGISLEDGAKVIMTTALNDEKNVKMAFELGCTIYSGKPIDQEKFEQALKKIGLI